MIPFLSRKRIIAIYGVVLWVGSSLLCPIAHAQNQLICGVEIGAGSSQLYHESIHASVAADPFSDRYVHMNYEEGGASPVVQLGGYVRYYMAGAFFVQSGLSYRFVGGEVGFETESLLSSDEPGAGWPPGFHVDRFAVRYRYHQVETPILLGVRFAKQIRLYVGPTVGVALHTGTQVNTSDHYELTNDPVFRNLRVGIGADTKRLSLDIYRQATFPQSNASRFRIAQPLPNYFPSREVSAGYENVGLISVVVLIGYRLY